MQLKNNPVIAWGMLGATLIFGLIHGQGVINILESGKYSYLVSTLLVFQCAVEIGACFFASGAILYSVAYIVIGKSREPARPITEAKPVGIFYLCCDDFDRQALESLLTLRYPGSVHLVIHDDSRSPASRAAVDAAARNMELPPNFQLYLLRRPQRTGGKPGAVNYMLEQTGHLFPYFLLCDNDSTAVDPDALIKGIPHFSDRHVGIVQCRSVSFEDPKDSNFNRILRRSIDVFHLFMAVSARFGWRLFIGHNALLRTAAVKEVGGLTPGFFSDDLDLTFRMNLSGYKVVYEETASIGEKHPRTYNAFRRRTYKWAYGCMQMLMTHGKHILTTSRLTFAEKISFLYFTGFYIAQSILLVYLSVTFLIAPFYLDDAWSNVYVNMAVGTVLILLVYLPTLTYFIKERRLRESLTSIPMCGLVYGVTDFVCAAATIDCLLGTKRQWVPTNAAQAVTNNWTPYLEALFGAVLLAVPLEVSPALLYLPCVYLYVGKFLFAPAITILYAERAVRVPALPSLQQEAEA